jgi:2,4-dienoyl-CoA reductase-like NADH-dependent reductase (Old Yellow Enzyme family)
MNRRLFEPLAIRAHTARNRLWVSPMCQYSAEAGLPNDWHLVHLGALAVCGPGLVMAEATAVLPEGRITPSCTGIWNDEQAERWARIAHFVAGQGSVTAIQLAHAGRKGSTRILGEPDETVPVEQGGWQTVAPSPAAYGAYAPPRELTADEIADIVGAFGAAAARAEAAGFDVVEVHAAHGYLLGEFLSPLSNHRNDRYGGSYDNRIRLLLEVVDAVRRSVSDRTGVFVRLSATDWVPDGWNVEHTAALVPYLEARGVDLIDISSAGLDPRQQIPVGPGYQVELASRVRKSATVPVSAVGLLTSPAEFEQVLADGHADVVFAGREFLRDRLLPLRAAAELGVPMEWPRQYRMARFAGAIP